MYLQCDPYWQYPFSKLKQFCLSSCDGPAAFGFLRCCVYDVRDWSCVCVFVCLCVGCLCFACCVMASTSGACVCVGNVSKSGWSVSMLLYSCVNICQKADGSQSAS